METIIKNLAQFVVVPTLVAIIIMLNYGRLMVDANNHEKSWWE